MKIFVDADPIVYLAGASAQEVELHVVWSPQDSDDVKLEIFAPHNGVTAHAQMKEWEKQFEEGDEPVILEVDKVIVPHHVSHALSTTRRYLNGIKEAVLEKWPHVTPTLIVLLSGPGNFRDDLATVKGYKANRDESAKPYWYQQIRNYLTETWDAQVISGREADDECAILQYADNCDGVIASIDKDLEQVPGWHYDYKKKVFVYVTEDEGWIKFYSQVLSGDSVDNIPGCYQIGTSRAAGIIDAVYMEHGIDHAKIWETILKVYDDSLERYDRRCPYYDLAHEKGVEAVATEMARLVKMQEYEGQLWTPPGQPDEILHTEFE